uniref:Uncharacterized protein n=1 Tax=Chromera velia CCMP2878 TaxID=1169474 RepID=A0A0G4G291_9ALVE|eukprot:Cvel_4090.t1-p1 / transcript=Cvel_4090.t1 / gene=Cvel_4090 / organism=Chromera_velia_CCMP2878 / gene_product=hypothetical protein / transcript_product=hypothetical protein / location=Cvel_scaffold174:41432-46416(+) / protein_length=592 / sequence_SO=supercontig / SO=protein_coding / is_pseudo=false
MNRLLTLRRGRLSSAFVRLHFNGVNRSCIDRPTVVPFFRQVGRFSSTPPPFGAGGKRTSVEVPDSVSVLQTVTDLLEECHKRDARTNEEVLQRLADLERGVESLKSSVEEVREEIRREEEEESESGSESEDSEVVRVDVLRQRTLERLETLREENAQLQAQNAELARALETARQVECRLWEEARWRSELVRQAHENEKRKITEEATKERTALAERLAASEERVKELEEGLAVAGEKDREDRNEKRKGAEKEEGTGRSGRGGQKTAGDQEGSRGDKSETTLGFGSGTVAPSGPFLFPAGFEKVLGLATQILQQNLSKAAAVHSLQDKTVGWGGWGEERSKKERDESDSDRRRTDPKESSSKESGGLGGFGWGTQFGFGCSNQGGGADADKGLHSKNSSTPFRHGDRDYHRHTHAETQHRPPPSCDTPPSAFASVSEEVLPRSVRQDQGRRFCAHGGRLRVFSRESAGLSEEEAAEERRKRHQNAENMQKNAKKMQNLSLLHSEEEVAEERRKRHQRGVKKMAPPHSNFLRHVQNLWAQRFRNKFQPRRHQAPASGGTTRPLGGPGTGQVVAQYEKGNPTAILYVLIISIILHR